MLTLKEYSKKQASEIVKSLQKLNLKEVKGEGTFEVIATTEGVDRDGEVIMVNGWDFANFMKNPVVLFGHDYWSFPIGAVTEVISEGGKVIAKGVFARTEEGQKARLLYDDGILKTVSVGFIVKERNGNIITKAELLELSFVPVPSNPEARDMRKAVEELEQMLTSSTMTLKTVIPFDEAYSTADKKTPWNKDKKTERKEAYGWISDDKKTLKFCHHAENEEGELVTVLEGVRESMVELLTDTELSEDEKKGVYAHLKKHYKEFHEKAPELKSYTQYELDNLFPTEKDAPSEGQKAQINFVIRTLKEDVNNLVADAVEKIGTVTGSSNFDAEPIQKAGRVLSAKTRTTITNAVDAMGQAVKELKELLEATNSTEDEVDKSLNEGLLKMLQSIDKTVEKGIVDLKNRVK